MKGIKNKMVVFLAVSVGGMIGIIKGEEAKQKWRHERRSAARKPAVWYFRQIGCPQCQPVLPAAPGLAPWLQ